MYGNSAKLVGTQSAGPQTPPATSPQLLTTLTKPALASTQGVVQSSSAKSAAPQEVGTPSNRRIDKSQFEIGLTAIVDQIMREHSQQRQQTNCSRSVA